MIKYWIKFYISIHKTSLYLAVEKQNIQIVELLLSRKDLKSNILNIYKAIFSNIVQYFTF